MPIALDTNETVDVALDTDEQKPEAERPVFVFHHLSYKQFREMERLRDEAETLVKTDEDGGRNLYEKAIRIGLVGWRNMGDNAYSADADLSFLTKMEAFELAWKYPGKLQLSEMEKNGRSSRLQSSPAPSPASPPLPNPSNSATDPVPNVAGT